MASIPNRESDLARPRERKGSDEQGAKRGQLQPIQMEWLPNPEWDQMADMTWESAKCSGMADFYQDTDYAELWFICNELDKYSKMAWKDGTPRQSPEMVKALLQGLSNLGFTEGDRRRIRIELDAPEPEQASASVVALTLYQGALGNSSQADDEEEVPGG